MLRHRITRAPRWFAVVAVIAAISAPGCSEDDGSGATGDDASVTTVSADDQLTARPKDCVADGTVTGAATASFTGAPAGSAGGAVDPSGAPAYYQTSDRDVVVSFRSDEWGTGLLTVRTGAGAWTSAPGDAIEVAADGSGAVAAGVTLMDPTAGDIVVDVTIACR